MIIFLSIFFLLKKDYELNKETIPIPRILAVEHFKIFLPNEKILNSFSLANFISSSVKPPSGPIIIDTLSDLVKFVSEIVTSEFS